MDFDDYLIAGKILGFNFLDFKKMFYKKSIFEIENFDLKKEINTKVLYEIKKNRHYLKSNFINLIHPEHDNYPINLNQLEEPPYFLTVKGNINKNSAFLSIVGAREASSHVLGWLDKEINELLKRVTNVTIVSGGARGVDQKAHEIAIRNQAQTIVVLPSGIAEPYPEYWCKKMFHKILNLNGAFISEYLPYEKIHKKNFVLRNRLISGLSHCTLIAQSTTKSGTQLTAAYALKQNRELLSIPDFPDNINMSGNLKLIKEGATIVCDHLDIEIAIKRNFFIP